MAKANIYLAGFMGTGKSTIGRELARVVGRKYIDIDQAIEEEFGASIPALFAERGEAWFREQEKTICLKVSQSTNRVVAAGGGALMNAEIFAAFEATGLLICLYTQRDCLVERLQRSTRRPLLNGGDLPDKVDSLLATRQSLYDKIRIRVDTTNFTPLETARRIADLLNTRQRALQRLCDQYIDLC